MIIIAVVFLIPIWRLARSKGYNGKAFVLVPGILAGVANALGIILEPRSYAMNLIISAATLGIPLLTLGLAAMLPSRPGAPGKAWLTIAFPCPECGKPLSFRRELEGLKRRCPHCEENVLIRDDPEAG